jgi:hypothetical protein
MSKLDMAQQKKKKKEVRGKLRKRRRRRRRRVRMDHTLFERSFITEHSGMSLHGALHLLSDLGSRTCTVRITNAVNPSNTFFSSILLELGDALARFEIGSNMVGAGTAEYNNIQQRIGSETVGAVYRSTSSLTSSIETRHNVIWITVLHCHDLTMVVGGDTSHVVVNGGKNRNGLLSHIDASKDESGFRDAGQSLVEDVWGQVVQMQKDVILTRAYIEKTSKKSTTWDS